MPADPNSRRDKALEGILGELRRTNSLLAAQNKVIERMERHARPTVFDHSYLEKSDGGTESGSGNPEGASSTDGVL